MYRFLSWLFNRWESPTTRIHQLTKSYCKFDRYKYSCVKSLLESWVRSNTTFSLESLCDHWPESRDFQVSKLVFHEYTMRLSLLSITRREKYPEESSGLLMQSCTTGSTVGIWRRLFKDLGRSLFSDCQSFQEEYQKEKWFTRDSLEFSRISKWWYWCRERNNRVRETSVSHPFQETLLDILFVRQWSLSTNFVFETCAFLNQNMPIFQLMIYLSWQVNTHNISWEEWMAIKTEGVSLRNRSLKRIKHEISVERFSFEGLTLLSHHDTLPDNELKDVSQPRDHTMRLWYREEEQDQWLTIQGLRHAMRGRVITTQTTNTHSRHHHQERTHKNTSRSERETADLMIWSHFLSILMSRDSVLKGGEFVSISLSFTPSVNLSRSQFGSNGQFLHHSQAWSRFNDGRRHRN